jgi:hypothetical protein
MTRALHVAGVGLWVPGVSGVEAWRAGARGAQAGEPFEPPSAESIERRSRRRASPLTRACSCAFTEAARQAGIDVATTGAVFGSALGEVSTMLELLDQMGKREPLSPMGFTTSVHHSAAGTVSISGGNRGFTTSISANHDTPAAAIFEASGVCATMGTPVVAVCGDDQAPERFVEGDEAYDMIASAIALVPEDASVPLLCRISMPFIGEGERELAIADVPRRIANNPQVGLLDLVDAIVAGREGVARLDRGRGLGWCVRVSAA